MTAEEKLQRISDIYESIRKVNGLTVSTHARLNLEGAIHDIKRMKMCDDTSMATLELLVLQLEAIEGVLNA